MRRLILVLILLCAPDSAGSEESRLPSECTHYAAPHGSGNGASPAQAFRTADFWRVARPGYTLCLVDGVYQGPASMIKPPPGLSGTRELPVTVRALDDGKATINGRGREEPVRLQQNDFFVLEGFNAHASVNNVVTVSKSNHNVVRRVVAWDAADNNTSIYAINHGNHNLLEDVAGWGIARKTFSSSQAGNSTTIRRAWGRWEGSHVVGPKMTYDLAYNNYDLLVENSIGTWNGDRVRASYPLSDYAGKRWKRRGAGNYHGRTVDQPYGIFSVGGFSNGDRNPRSRLLGSIAYFQRQELFQPDQVIYITTLDAIQLTDIVAYVPDSDSNKITFKLDGLKHGIAARLSANSLTSIGGSGAQIASQWKTRQMVQVSHHDNMPSVFAARAGANLCFRYHNGTLTDSPLWPWPMNQRISHAMIASGRDPVDVTGVIEKLFGSIPDRCKVGSASSR